MWDDDLHARADPGSLQTLGHLPDMDVGDVKRAIMAASDAYTSWSKQTPAYREQILQKWYQLAKNHKSDLARLMTLESGKPVAEAETEIEYGASFIKWFAEEGRRAYGDHIPAPLPDRRYIVIKQPMGVVGVITPWNFPIAMITRKVSAALAAGNTVVVKPASETPYSALALCELARRAGIPPGVLNVVTSHTYTSDIGSELSTNPTVAKISFTGSTKVGKKLMELASSTMKRVSFELGGNAPFIVFDDADLDKAADGLIACKFRNAGQTCVCPNRVYVHRSVRDQFVERFVARVKGLKIGHGLGQGTNIGPLIHERALAKVGELVDDAVSKGARVECGGKSLRSELGGYYYEPTVITGATDEMRFTQEEIFGPVCPVYEFDSVDEVVERANASRVGLSGYFYSRDVGRVWQVAEAMQVGIVGVNTGSISTEVGPFGGVKESGIGREGSKYGLDEYLNLKWITIAF
ncbi:hypothetical protein EV182_000960 [Spiromyces aspiralis]|uniref:Uncharacterized protein n=1 Tax=Spiromyces aspiralis TaxID=68401 RepID=A0ACC1HJT7_9FUNG|nr:hypothetical protein EV182_000960 [Spiromyces aspiralis]